MITIFEIEGLPVELSRKRVKNVNLRVSAKGIKLTFPYRMKEAVALDFVKSKLDWIKKHHNKYLQQQIPEPMKYVNGEHFVLFGDSCKIFFEESKKRREASVVDGSIILYSKNISEIDVRKNALNNFLKMSLNMLLPSMISKWEQLLGVKINAYTIRNMRSKWGSCNITRKKITFSTELAKKSIQCIDYVVLHELVHLLEKGHNKRFWTIISSFMPDWKKIRKELNGVKSE